MDGLAGDGLVILCGPVGGYGCGQGRYDGVRGILAIMPELIGGPSRVTAAGEPAKLIDEYVGRASTGHTRLSIAHMRSPSGWAEPGQRPDFDEFTIVLHGDLVVESDAGHMTVQAGQGVHTSPGEWVRYSTPGADGAEYISVCMPAFAPGTVNRDD
jgi:mannose-6-phosphate isomerase-like protein (cupin superfamily)